jgi:hypothetical protein
MKTKHPLPNMNVIDIEKEKAIIAAAQARLEQQAEIIKAQEARQSKVAYAQQQLLNRQEAAKLQVAAAEKYFKDIQAKSKKFKIVYETINVDASPLDYEAERLEDGNRPVIAEVKGDLVKAHIKFLSDNVNLKIYVSEHYTSNSSWHQSNKGYMMFTSGISYSADRKPIKSAKTIISKIEDHYDTIVSATNEADKIKNMFRDAKWSETYPGATVVKETIYIGKWRGRNYDKYHSHCEGVKVTLANGIAIVLRPYASGEWSIQSVKYPTPTTPTGSSKEVMEALNNMKF